MRAIVWMTKWLMQMCQNFIPRDGLILLSETNDRFLKDLDPRRLIFRSAFSNADVGRILKDDWNAIQMCFLSDQDENLSLCRFTWDNLHRSLLKRFSWGVVPSVEAQFQADESNPFYIESRFTPLLVIHYLWFSLYVGGCGLPYHGIFKV